MADSLKGLLGSLKAVEKSGDISQRNLGDVNKRIDSLDSGSMLTDGSILDDETLTHYVGGGGSQPSLRSMRNSYIPQIKVR